MVIETDIVYKPSAFKHGCTQADILWALQTARYDELMEGWENKHLLLGFDTHSNPLEVMYNDLGDNMISLFHAMTCRTVFISLMKP